MSLSHQKPSFFSLALPRPPVTLSPCVPLQQLPTVSPNRQFTPSRPRHSTDSWNSVEDETTHDWTPDQLAILVTSLDGAPSHLASPFSGSIPPSNLLDNIGRHILDTRPREEWPHSLRSTRIKLLHIAKQQAQAAQHLQQYPTNQSRLTSPPPNPNAPRTNLKTPGPRASSRRMPLYRQNSMDFLPIPEEKPTVASRNPGSSSLQRSERVVAHAPFHPYERSHRFKPHTTTGPSPLSHHTSSDDTAASRTQKSSHSMLLGSPTLTSSPRSRKRIQKSRSPEADLFDLSSTFSSSASSSSTHVATTPALGASDSRDPIIPMVLSGSNEISASSIRSRRAHAVSRKRSREEDDSIAWRGSQGDANSFDNSPPSSRSSSGSLARGFSLVGDARQIPKRTCLSSFTSTRPHPYSRPSTPPSATIYDSPRLRRVGTGKYFSRDDENTMPRRSISPDLNLHRMVGRKISFGSDHGHGPVGLASRPYVLDAPFEDVTGVHHM